MSNTQPPSDYMQALWDFILQGQMGGQPTLGAATPYMTPANYNMWAGTVPEDEDELDLMRDQVNASQDLAQTYADPVFLAMMGGMAGFSPDAFEPTYTDQIVDSPELNAINRYMNSDSVQGLFATTLWEGGDPLQSVAELQARMGDIEFDTPLEEIDPLVRPWVDTNVATGERMIDWDAMRQEAIRVTDDFFQIPSVGPTEDGGQRQLIGEPGNLQLVESVATPSPMAEDFRRLGLPLPTEQFTPEYMLGPDWQAGTEQFLGTGRSEVDALKQEWMDLPRGNNEDIYGYQRSAASAPPQSTPAAAAGVNTVGTTNQPLTGGAGIPEEQVNLGPYGGGYVNQPPTSMTQGMANTRNPVEYLEWYNANANNMTDEQRFEAAAHPQQMALHMGDPAMSLAWEQVSDQINNDFVETAQGGGLGGIDLPDVLQSQNALVTQAGQITNPDEFVEFLNANAAQMNPDDLVSLGVNISNRGPAWTSIGDQLISGRFVPGTTSTPTNPPVGGRSMRVGGEPPQPPQPLGSLYTTGAAAPPAPPTPPPGPALLNQQWETQGPPGTPASDYVPASMVRALLGSGNVPPQIPGRASPMSGPAGQPPPGPPRSLNAQTSMRPGVYVGGYVPPNYTTTHVTSPRPAEYEPPPGGFPTLEQAAAAGSTAAQEYLQNNPPTTPTPGPAQPRPEHGWPTFEAAAAAGSEAAIQYLLENGPTPSLRAGGLNDVTSPIPGRPGVTTDTVTTAGPRPAGSRSPWERFMQTFMNMNGIEEMPRRPGSYGDEHRQPIETGIQTSGSYGDEHREPGQQPGPRQRPPVAGAGPFTGGQRDTDEALKRYLAANDAWVAEKNRLYGAEYGSAMAQAANLRMQGVTPTMAAMMARQYPTAAMGVTQRGRLPR